MSSSSNDGYCLRISFLDVPELRNSIIVCTVILFPLIVGFPLHISGSMVILPFMYVVLSEFTDMLSRTRWFTLSK